MLVKCEVRNTGRKARMVRPQPLRPRSCTQAAGQAARGWALALLAVCLGYPLGALSITRTRMGRMGWSGQIVQKETNIEKLGARKCAYERISARKCGFRDPPPSEALWRA